MLLRIQIISIIISLLFLALVLFLVYKRRLREGYSLIWLFCAFTLIGISISGGALTQVAIFLGISYVPSLLFAVSTLFIFIIVLSQAIAITSLARRNRDLAQKLAILDWHVEQIRIEEAALTSVVSKNSDLAQKVGVLEGDIGQLRARIGNIIDKEGKSVKMRKRIETSTKRS